MITYKQGDLLKTSDKIILHGCNAQGVMGSGVAKQIKQEYPKAYQDYKDFCNLREPDFLIGRVNTSPQPDGKIILNCITQYYYGKDSKRYVSYDAMDDCMEYVKRYLTQKTDISMPLIGAGLGGGSWPIIQEIIKTHLNHHNITVWQL